jgi:hypothetical protein
MKKKLTIPAYSLVATATTPAILWHPVCVLIMLFCANLTFVQAQGTNGTPQPLTVEDYQKALAFKINNPEEDTYIKYESTYILDREAKPYVFSYSDGIERRIYLYKLMKGANREEVGTFALYRTPKNGKAINICIPNARADKKVWDLYIDDLKLQEEKEKGFLSTLAFVLSREYAQRQANPGLAKSSSKDDGDYDFCFPGEALVFLADGTLKPIAQIAAGDKVMAFDPETNETRPATTKEVKEHYRAEGIPLTKLVLAPMEEIIVSSNYRWASSSTAELLATANHPVHTKEGKKTMGKISEGDILFYFDQALDEFREYRVLKAISDYQNTDRVYNLITDSGNYLVNGLVVLDK